MGPSPSDATRSRVSQVEPVGGFHQRQVLRTLLGAALVVIRQARETENSTPAGNGKRRHWVDHLAELVNVEVDCFGLATFEEVRRRVEQLLIPVGDLRRVHAVDQSQLGRRLVTL